VIGIEPAAADRRSADGQQAVTANKELVATTVANCSDSRGARSTSSSKRRSVGDPVDPALRGRSRRPHLPVIGIVNGTTITSSPA
jgi:hypothetical protein